MVNPGVPTLINRVGLTTYMNDESDQYALLTKTFVESFTFSSHSNKPYVAFRIYDMPITLSLERFCSIVGVANTETTKKIQDHPTDLMELYRGIINDDDRRAQHDKIRNIQFPVIRYFVYYLATSVLGRENTSNISNYHLAFLAAALNGRTPYNLGALIARRLATKGPIYGGIIVARVIYYLELSPSTNDVFLPPQRLDLNAMKVHQFVTTNSCVGNIVYMMLFIDGEEKEVPLLQPTLFDIHRKPWSRTKEEMDEQLRWLGFHEKHDPVYQGGDAPSDDYTAHYIGASSSSYQDEGPSSSYYGGATSWSPWD